MIEYEGKIYYTTTELNSDYKNRQRIENCSTHLRKNKCFSYSELGAFVNMMRKTGKIRYLTYRRFSNSTQLRYAYCVEELEEDLSKCKKERIPQLQTVWDIKKVEIKEE